MTQGERRASPFAITAATNTLRIDAKRSAVTAFTVANATGNAITGRAIVRAAAPETTAWFAIEGDAEHSFQTNEAYQYRVNVKVPEDVAAGIYTFTLDVVGVENPDELFSQGPPVSIEVPASQIEKKELPRWWWVPVVAVVFLLIVGTLIFVVTRDGGGERIAVPDVGHKVLSEAEAQLQAAGLSVGTVTQGTGGSPPGTVIDQRPGAGERVKRGSAVDLTVQATPTSTPTPTPTPRPATLTVRSNPPGATVEVGIQVVNGIVTPGTGRVVGTTPVTVELGESDLYHLPNGETGINGSVRLAGYLPHFFVIGLGPGGKLPPGREFMQEVELRRP